MAINSKFIWQTSPALICTWFLKNQVMKNQIWKIKFKKSTWTNLYIVHFELQFMQATQAVKIKFEINKRNMSNLNFQTRIYKNLMQIRRGPCCSLFSKSFWHLTLLRRLLHNTLFNICPEAKTSETAMILFYIYCFQIFFASLLNSVSWNMEKNNFWKSTPIH